jgi:predicted phage tail protein
MDLVIGWTASPDVRTTYYEVRYKRNNGSWVTLDKTGETTYDWRDVEAGTYDISVRGKGLQVLHDG